MATTRAKQRIHRFAGVGVLLLAGSTSACHLELAEAEICEPGLERRCGNEIGTCRQGYQQCDEIGLWSACIGAVEACDETCDNQDNDCNGVIDDLQRVCENACGESGTEQCLDGNWVCDVVTPDEECGDGFDNDCDGTIDEGCACGSEIERSCGSDIGECVMGIQRCLDAQWTLCEGAIGPAPEGDTCDQLDNDCDGDTDEDIDCYPNYECICTPGEERPCPDIGQCIGGVQKCIGRLGNEHCYWQDCVYPGGTQPEVCNGEDDDCDGVIDDGLRQPCNAGPCPGYQVCSQGQWGACQGSSSTEVCNGRDDDCDGSVDEGMSQTSCSTACGTGTKTCTNGRWVCNAPQGSPETCDGQDNDCDGSTDEGLQQTCTYQCSTGGSVAGTKSCSNGSWGPCQANQPCPF